MSIPKLLQGMTADELEALHKVMLEQYGEAYARLHLVQREQQRRLVENAVDEVKRLRPIG